MVRLVRIGLKRTNLIIDDIISLLDVTLSNKYFIYNVTYKQIHGCALASSVKSSFS